MVRNRPVFPDYPSLVDHLNGMGCFHMRLGLSRVRTALERLDIDPSPAIQVVGTNGKGSTAVFLEALARGHGLRTGLYTSPHLVSIRERIKMNGRALPEAEWASLATQVYDAWPEADLTYFELLTIMALVAFKRQGVDLAVFEAGLGAANDATSAVPPMLSVITPIGLDHQQVIGPGLADIARDKAATLRAHGGAVSGPQDQVVMDILRSRAKSVGAFLHMADEWWTPRGQGALFNPLGCPEDGFFVPRFGLSGSFQASNAMLALAAWWLAAKDRGWPFEIGPCIQSLADARHPGRFQFLDVGPGFLVDGAHNEHGLTALAAAMSISGIEPEGAIFACLGDKSGLTDMIRNLVRGPILVPGLPGNERALDPSALAAKIGGRPFETVAEAVRAALELPGPVLVCGSLYLVGAFLTELSRIFPVLETGLEEFVNDARSQG
ncbi:MAG: bifunctional folylpolyglutamate synthase/dihydrofolate synthase [Deltaproteobacteria bacterium]|nr:bifunctional folylpolyglutamate synthase/dihydrofolate synthase [Deltaproteobacteria bacterium]